MATITIPKREYQTLKQKAGLYDTVLRRSARKAFEIERYSPARIREFMDADRVSKSVAAKVKRMLKSA